MIYIIDGNNLAGQMKLLEQKVFSDILFARLKSFFKNKACRVFLVFDSVDFMGDRFKDGFFEVVYTPRDNFYASADDKILEIAENFLTGEDLKEDVAVITDDVDLQGKIKLLIAYNAKKNRVKMIRATDFSRTVIRWEDNQSTVGLTDKTEAELDADDLNAELLKIWGKQ
jgi:hypothetical protein